MHDLNVERQEASGATANFDSLGTMQRRFLKMADRYLVSIGHTISCRSWTRAHFTVLDHALAFRRKHAQELVTFPRSNFGIFDREPIHIKPMGP